MTQLTTQGLRHLALTVKNLEETTRFYTNILNMTIEWQPDADNIYLSSGQDNLALHRAPQNFNPDRDQRLDHLGFIIKTPQEVDAWYDHFVEHHITIKAKPRTHRDGARSFYATDPEGNLIQMIYHPPLSKSLD